MRRATADLLPGMHAEIGRLAQASGELLLNQLLFGRRPVSGSIDQFVLVGDNQQAEVGA